MISKRWGVAVLINGLALSGCAVGPVLSDSGAVARDGYAKPQETTVSAPVANGARQSLRWGENPQAAWWRTFGSAALTSQVEEGLRDSPSVASALAVLQQAHSQWEAAKGTVWFPKVDAQLNAQREKLMMAPGEVVGPLNLYGAGINVSYNLDVFGAARYGLQELAAEEDYQRLQWQAVRQTLSANILLAAINAAYSDQQILLTQQLLDVQNQQLALLQGQLKAGAVTAVEVANQEALVAQTAAGLPALRKARQQAVHQLNVLRGKSPNAAVTTAAFADIHLPADLPVSLPSELLQRRPDIQAAEALRRAAAAGVGVASANRYPQLTLTASMGTEALTMGRLFKTDSLMWSAGAGLVQPIFNGGALLARKRAAQAAYESSDQQYRATVLQAFQSVADVLEALNEDALTQQARYQAADAAQRALDLTAARYRLGAVTYATLLLAQIQSQQSQMALLQSTAQRLTDVVALFQALGGHWSEMDMANLDKGGR